MSDTPDWWGRILGGLGLVVSVATFVLGRRDRQPKVLLYAHRAPDRTGGSPFQSAHATAIGPDEPAIWPPARENLYLIVRCNKDTDLSKAWFQFGDQVVDVQSAQLQPPVRLLPHKEWHGWIPWNSVPNGVTEADAQTLGRAILTVTGTRVHESKPTPPILLLGGNVPGPEA